MHASIGNKSSVRPNQQQHHRKGENAVLLLTIQMMIVHGWTINKLQADEGEIRKHLTGGIISH